MRRIRPHSDYWHRTAYGDVRFVTNNRGFRNNEDIQYDKAEGELRVISLGDSHTQGYKIRQEYTFSSVIERYLRKQNYQATVINAGVAGFSTAEELVFLENEGFKYKPDVVVLGFSINDFIDNIKADFFKLDRSGELIVNKKTHIPGVKVQNFIYSIPFMFWISQNSHFYSYSFNTAWNWFRRQFVKKAANRTAEYIVPTENDFSAYKIALTSELIKRMYAFCQKHDIKLIIIDIPTSDGFNELQPAVSPELQPLRENQNCEETKIKKEFPFSPPSRGPSAERDPACILLIP